MEQTAKTARVDHIPVVWVEPEGAAQSRRLVIFLNGLSGNKEGMLPYLSDLARAGFVALSFDNWEHGERTSLNQGQIIERAFGNFRRYMWVNIGQTALDALRVIDWAVDTLGVEAWVGMGGLSMGGDIAVAAAGIDRRIERVGAVVATPDWLRPGMTDLRVPGHPLLPAGAPDAYAQKFYDLFNPITHLEHYAHAPEIHFVCGEKDDHVPPEAAFRFQAALAEQYPRAGERVTIEMIAGQDHGGVGGVKESWWPGLVEWFLGMR